MLKHFKIDIIAYITAIIKSDSLSYHNKARSWALGSLRIKTDVIYHCGRRKVSDESRSTFNLKPHQ